MSASESPAPSSPMKASESYLLSAQDVKKSGACCLSIGAGCPMESRRGDCRCSELRVRFTKLFKPDEGATGYWFGDRGKNINERTLALCFMAAISESEGD